MKQKHTLFFAMATCAVLSLALTSSAGAININSLNIIQDTDPTDSVVLTFEKNDPARAHDETIKYSSVYNILSEKNNNPATSDNISAIVCISIAAVVFMLTLLFAKTRRGFNKSSCFVLALAIIGMLAGILGLNRDYEIYADESGVETISIKDKAFYDALKSCLLYPDGDNSSPRHSFNAVFYSSDSYDCEYDGNIDDIVFNDSAQTVLMDPSKISVLDVHEKGISDISDLLNFPNLEWFFAYNNDISDISILKEENFPNLMGHIVLDYNHISDIENPYDCWKVGVLFAQSFDIRANEDGVFSLPGIFRKLVTDLEVADDPYERYSTVSYKAPIHVHNVELSDDLSSGRVVNLGEEAYISFSYEEMRADWADWYEEYVDKPSIPDDGLHF